MLFIIGALLREPQTIEHMFQLSLMHYTTALSRQSNFIYCGKNEISFREGTGLVPILPVEQVTVFCIRWWDLWMTPFSKHVGSCLGALLFTLTSMQASCSRSSSNICQLRISTDCTQQLLSFKPKCDAKENESQWRLDVDMLCAVFSCQTFSWPLDFWWMFLPVSWLWCFYIWLGLSLQHGNNRN